ncbi:taste receptor type 2 member 1 [Peromyscus californicus insignis]|uniref:taste receptor type 2 member 1 n=1 Tax=Peromyscus californicus insignis TaxID=564181 RepID=UPI0022A6759C|nr:taste receptor type 2 member 1 [Peromyscus californicus insignis]
MLQGYILFLFLVVMVQLFTGILANGLIVVVNATDLITRRKMSPLGLLLSCLATSRIILQLCILFAQLGLFCLAKSSLFADNVAFVFFINELSLWFATWLCVFYCAKIATISLPLFLWLKMRISRLIPWLILGSVLYSTVTVMIHGRETSIIPKQMYASFFSENATQVIKLHNMALSVIILGLTLPSLIFIVAVLLLIFSLWNHSWKMRTVVGTSRYAHISAMLSFLSFFILYFCHYMVALVVCTQGFQLGSIDFLYCTLLVGMYPSLHSVILILGNPKLRQNVKMFFVHCKCCHCVRAEITSRK